MSPSSSSSPVRRLRAATALVLPASALALVGLGAPAHAANPSEDCVLSGSSFSCALVYNYTGGEQTLLVPDDVSSIDVTAVGGAGGGSAGGGRGAVVTGSVDVAPGSTYYVVVGGNGGVGGGFNGGGAPNGDTGTGGGGGATDLRSISRGSAGTLESRLVVAGGGGGSDVGSATGGDAGLNGANGQAGLSATGGPGLGGTQSAGGAGGTGASAGVLGDGGTGGSPFGAGGGGGLYGGGGGGASSSANGNGGGGGSSLVPTGGSAVVNPGPATPRLVVTYASPIIDADLQVGATSVAAGVFDPVTMTVTDGSVTASVTPSLSIAPSGAGTGATCTSAGCSATQIGTYTVTGTYAGVSRKVTFSVVAGPAASIELTPESTSTTAGTQVAYTVEAIDEFGNDLGDVTAESLVTTTGPGGDDVVCPSGVCRVEVAGSYAVAASTPGIDGEPVVDSATLDVTASDLSRLVVSPAQAIVPVGQDRTYVVVGKDRFGNDLGDLTAQADLSFAPVDGGAATPCDAATCRPTTAGAFAVTAEVAAVSGTATIVAQANPATVVVDPVDGVVFGDDVPVSATVSSPAGPVDGTVQLNLDGTSLGAPVAVGPDGAVALPALTGVRAGLHTLRASYASTGGAFASAADVTAFVVAKAPSTVAVTAEAGKLTAAVSSVGTPTGTVHFLVDGVDVGQADLVDGTAVLAGPYDGGSVVGATYGGDADHEAAATSTARSNPVVRTRVSGVGASGWSVAPVTVTFVCESDVVACPAPATLDKEGVAQYVSRTVVGTDGGVSVVTAGPFNLDLTAPTATLSRVADGRTYKGRARVAQCQGADALSGLATCTVATTGGPFGTMTSTVTATDLAGNATTSSATYRVLDTWVARAKQDGSRWTVRGGKRSTLHVMSTKMPRLKAPKGVAATGFRMVGRTGGITHWAATVRPGGRRTVTLAITSSEGKQVVRLRAAR